MHFLIEKKKKKKTCIRANVEVMERPQKVLFGTYSQAKETQK